MSRRRRRYTPEEIAFIERHYTLQGAAWLAEKLGRTPAGIAKIASQRGLTRRYAPKGRVAVVDLAADLGVWPDTIRSRAQRAGVLIRTGRTRTGKSMINSVPKWWADHIRATTPTQDASEYDEAGWFTPERAAAYIGLSASTVRKALTGVGGAVRFFTDPTVALARTSTGAAVQYLHPDTVEHARRLVSAELALARRMVPVRNIAIDLGVTYPAVQQRIARRGIRTRVLLTPGRTMAAHVTPEDAAVLLGQPARRAA